MRNIPNMVVSAPMDEIELRNLMYTAQLEKNKSPFSIRYPKGCGMHSDWKRPFVEIEIGKARRITEGKDIAVLSIGHPGNFVTPVVEKLNLENIAVEHWDMRFAAPLDTEVLHSVFKRFDKIITVEDGILKGGFGSAVIEFMSDNGYDSKVRRLGIPDYFVEHGTQEELIAECGFDSAGIEKTIRELMGKTKDKSKKIKV
jgi:1-deoxy-D-xylulose-5-phosphate synthase